MRRTNEPLERGIRVDYRSEHAEHHRRGACREAAAALRYVDEGTFIRVFKIFRSGI